MTDFHGQPASGLAVLGGFRDLLTESFLRPHATPFSPFDVFGMPYVLNIPPTYRPGPTPQAFAHGMIGFGVGQTDDQGVPSLFIYAEYESDSTKAVLASLRASGVPVRLHAGVSFRAGGSRPVKGGQSLGHGSTNGASGTMGCVVKARADGSHYVLTCNHVIADLNAAHKGTTPVWAPGADRSGTANDQLGILHDFAHIDFRAGAYNVIDAALAKPGLDADVDAAIEQIGSISGVNYALGFGDVVQKSGVVTGHTHGKYRYQINGQISFANGQTALFRDMLVGTSANVYFAAQGDSGAVVLDDARRVAGLVISVASGIDLTLATAIKPLLDHFQVDVI